MNTAKKCSQNQFFEIRDVAQLLDLSEIGSLINRGSILLPFLAFSPYSTRFWVCQDWGDAPDAARRPFRWQEQFR